MCVLLSRGPSNNCNKGGKHISELVKNYLDLLDLCVISIHLLEVKFMSVHRSVGCVVGPSVSRLGGQPIGQSVGWSANRSINRFVCRSVGWLVGPSVIMLKRAGSFTFLLISGT